MPRETTIMPVLNGFVLQVGCQKVAFTSIRAMCSEVERYYSNPEAVEKEYIGNALNKMGGPLEQPACNTSEPAGLRVPDTSRMIASEIRNR